MLRLQTARIPLFFLIATLSFAGGCAYGPVRQVLRAQFASEFDCAEVTMVKRALWYASDGPDQYKVSGCGTLRTYTCPKAEGLVSYDEPICTWVEGDADAPKINTGEGDKPAPEMDLEAQDDAEQDDLDEDELEEPEPAATPKKPAGKAKPAGKKPAAADEDDDFGDDDDEE